MKKKAAVLLAVCLLMISVLAACGGGESSDSGSSGSDLITLKFPCIWVGSDSKAEVFGQMVQDFNEQYQGEIEVVLEEQTDYDAYRDKIRTQLSTGDAPDIFTVESYADLKLFVESGKVMDMTSFLAESNMADRFLEGLVDAAKIDDKNYGFPYENAYIPIMYNDALLKEAGVTKLPTTYDELWDACEKLKENGVFPITQMTNDNAWTSMLWYSYALAACGGPDATVVNGHFFNERAAIYTNGTWILGRIQSEGGEGLYDNINIGGSLSESGENGGAYLNVVQAYICAGVQEESAREEAIQKFFEFITEEDRIVDLSNSSGSTFAIETDVANIENELQADIITAGAEASFTIGHFQGSVPTSVANAFPAALESLVLGDVDAQGFVDILKAAE